ncbi:hypothetical protein G6F46_003405 [Rhizopus delemar]|uniref:UBX domain-containing protein 2 n=2 Tax=Rhizopus TaxID=4842 RepID=A0A9P6Z8T6_9FUNG|nr:hypothetical protein G6F55_002304 [Rhizopus delemar]KAG1548609.1 hypothetical protein G6F51_003564 [Rhizopus arrhizus]KAG1495145.1 hypothetical protein G6F54_007377 [Rhizopus delemar]KAG1509860.1 hypothetical protein G6F53_007120 [Rhizopus delemar]KAG1527808.1 hypothetical protein G6F52_001211 [Rhizopus delemar]
MSDKIWFTGPVHEAVSLVTQRNLVFLVYIYDDSDKSKILNDTFDDEEIAQCIENHAIALRMEKGSENAALFGQLYPIQTVPILYFIKQGTIKDFDTETITKQELLDKIKTVYNSTHPFEQQHATSSTSPSLQTSSTINATVENDVTTESNRADASNAEAIAAKKAELQKRLEEARKQREEREKMETKEKEIKRRNEAKMIQEAQQMKKDKENQIYLEKMKKERKEAEEHKRKVREQIARDREEKMAQRKANKERQELAASASSSSQRDNEMSTTKRQGYEFSNLNIRLLDGTNLRHQFEASDTLATLKDWIQQNRTDSNKSYKLSSQFPTRLFTEADDHTTLRDLDLCPSATIIMKPNHVSTSGSLNQPSNGQSGLFSAVQSGFDYVYALLISLINFFHGLLEALFPRNGYNPVRQPTATQQEPFVRNHRGGHRLGNSSSSVDSGKSTGIADKGKKRNTFATRVSTIHDKDESDSENEKRPTYNGNSVNHE